MISSESVRKDLIKDNKKQLRLNQCMKGLSSELAFVLNLEIPEITGRIRKNLRVLSAIHPQVQNALTYAEKD